LAVIIIIITLALNNATVNQTAGKTLNLDNPATPSFTPVRDGRKKIGPAALAGPVIMIVWSLELDKSRFRSSLDLTPRTKQR